jgi:hypothetical protein
VRSLSDTSPYLVEFAPEALAALRGRPWRERHLVQRLVEAWLEAFPPGEAGEAVVASAAAAGPESRAATLEAGALVVRVEVEAARGLVRILEVQLPAAAPPRGASSAAVPESEAQLSAP